MSDETRVMHSDPEILSGMPVFVGTRVPVQSRFDYLEGGDTLDDFSSSFHPFGANKRSWHSSSRATVC
jgi:uncharacterized protein (DUF433 family)